MNILRRLFGKRPQPVEKKTSISNILTLPPQFQADLQQAEIGEQSFMQRGDRRGLNEAAAAWERILQHPTFNNAPERFQLAAYNDGGGVFLRRFWAQGQIVDLNRALELWQTAVQRTPPDSPDLPSRLNNLGVGLSDRYDRTGQLADLEEAIGVWETAVRRTHPDAFDLPMYLGNLGGGLRARYAHTGQLVDLEEAISVYQTAVQRTPPDSPDLPMYLNNLGNGLSDRYAHTGQLTDLEEAIRISQMAVQRTLPDSPNLPALLNNLGIGLSDRYARTGQLADLEEAIRVYQTALQRTLPDSPDLAARLNNLGGGLSNRYACTGQLADLEDAISAWETAVRHTPPNALVLPALLSNLGGGLYDRYARTGQLADLEEAIRVYETAVQRTPPDSPDLPSRLNNLGNGIRGRYAHTGQLADLEQAISAYQTAVQRTPPDSPELPARLNNLGAGLSNRYARTGQLADLEEAIRVYETAVQRTPPDSPDLPMYLSNLGAGLSDRYARTGQLADLEEAIRVYETAVQRMPPDSPDLPSRLSNLGTGLRDRYARTGQLVDLEEAIVVHQTAVQRTTSDSPNLPARLNNLGNGLRGRYAHTGQLADLEKAIGAWQTVVQCTPPDSPDLPMYLNNLGTGLYACYAHTGQLANLEEAIGNYEQACQLGQERQPEVTLGASRSWGGWALARHTWDEAVRAYRYGLTALDQLYQTQLLQHEQQSWQREGQGLYAQTAYALARTRDLSAAAVALEHGQARGLNDRLARDEADLLQMQQQSPALFQQYQAVAERLRQLEAAERQERLISSGTATLPDWAAHRQQVQQARTDLQTAIAAIRQLDCYGEFLQPPEFADVVTAVRPGHPLAYLVTTPVGSLALLLHRPAANADVTIEPCWADAFTEDDLSAFLVKRENGEEPGGYLLGQFFSGPTLQTALAEGLPLLGETLLAPLAQRLEALDLQRVTLIPGGRLNLLPLHAATIAVNGQPAIFSDLFAVSYAPSARALSLSYHRRREYEATTPCLLAVGNPLPLPDDASPLPYARLEAEEIARRFGQGAHLVCAEAATHAAIAAAMPGRTHLHFACHGQFDPEKPLESGLLLGGNTLTLRQILDDITLRGVRLAVLSACQTAISDYKELPDEVIGLPAAFLQAGAGGVLGSLWPVNDLSTMLLMDRFYHLHLDERVEAAIALQRAQSWLREVTAGELAERFGEERMKLKGSRLILAEASEYWRRFASLEPEERPFADPYYWAAFTFTGA
ncbi:MAG: CHAT domain-containing protein [Chloroflexi bacterium]|nr:CHAT domain-containing protein [Chloroflexota bacterium]